MKQKVLTGLAALVFAATAGCSNGCIPNMQPAQRTPQVRHYKPSDRMKAIEDIMKSTVCIRAETEYESIFGNKNTTVTGGSGLVIARDTNSSYVLTNEHVATEPEYVVIVDSKFGTPVPHKRIKTDLYVTQGDTCADTGGDLATVQGVDEAVDLGLLKVSGTHLPVSFMYRTDPIEARPGDTIYMFGHPRLGAKAVTRGMMSNTRVNASQPLQDMVDITGTFGSSGSSYFIERKGVLYFGGVINSLNAQPYTRSKLFMFGIPSRAVRPFLKSKMGG